MPRRHLIIPDTQIKPGVDLRHIDWAAEAIVEYLPDVVVVIGDWWDMRSLNSHEIPGSEHLEGARIMDDIRCGNEAFERLVAPMQAEIERRIRLKKKRWQPECHFLFGNHEQRITRITTQDPKWDGLLTLDALKTPGFQRHPFLKIVEIDGIKYCHYFPNPHSGKAIGGTIVNRLNHIGSSFVQGHQQGFMYASKQFPDHVKHGLVAGRFYSHHENYRPDDVQKCEWNGVIVLNQVKDGDYDLMPMRYDYLQSKYSRAS
jgi:hypothetical protein